MKNHREQKLYYKAEESQSFRGWDFSYLDGRYFEDPPPWDYREKIEDFLKPHSRILDMGTGGGEFLLSLRHPYHLTSVTEGWRPNYELCMEHLKPLGIDVHFLENDDTLPFADDTFDIVLDRHEAYNLSEVSRVLKRNGYFITQQVGGRNNYSLSQKLIKGYRSAMPAFNLENEVQRFRQAGFSVRYRNQSYRQTVFTDVGAVCYYAKILPWEFPGFSVESCFEQLLALEDELAGTGKIVTESHRFIIIGQNKKKAGDAG